MTKANEVLADKNIRFNKFEVVQFMKEKIWRSQLLHRYKIYRVKDIFLRNFFQRAK